MNRIMLFIQKYKIHHILFWIFYFVLWVQIYKGFYENIVSLYKVTLVYAISHATSYYVTQYVLIPFLLKKKRIALFVFSLVMLLSALVVFMYVSIQEIMGFRLVGSFGGSVLSIAIFFGFSNLFTVLLLISIKTILDSIRNQRKQERYEKERLETELQYLKAQVNPHFLFNTINSVYVLIKKDPEKASETLIKLSDLLRSQLYDFGGEKITIEQELNYLENYIELERLRKGKKLIFEYEKSPSLHGFKIAPLLLMPFLENCFKHVSAYGGHENTIRVKLDYSGNRFYALFFNTKEENQGNSGPGGIGLKNVRRRLELLYPKEYTLEIHDRPDSFEVNLTLEIHD